MLLLFLLLCFHHEHLILRFVPKIEETAKFVKKVTEEKIFVNRSLASLRELVEETLVIAGYYEVVFVVGPFLVEKIADFHKHLLVWLMPNIEFLKHYEESF